MYKYEIDDSGNILKIGSPMTNKEILNELELLQEMLIEANGHCRSALMIAERKGGQTNWVGFVKTLRGSLDRQHKAIYIGA